MKALVARLVPPAGDKNWSFQTVHQTPEQRTQVLVAMRDDQVQACRPFRQGDSPEWLMIEFWTDDADKIKIAANHLAGAIQAELKHGDFTREEVLGR